MKRRIDRDQALWLRAHFQGLGQRETGAPSTLLKRFVGLQAQDYLAACLSLRVRSSGITLAKIETERQQERSIVRTWLMRGTLHLAAAEDVAWILPLLGPHFARGDQSRLRQLGWEPGTVEKGLGVLTRLLQEQGSSTRSKIAQCLEENHLPFTGQAPFHLIFRAALSGLLVQGADQEKEITYVLYESWLGRMTPLPEEEAMVRLIRRYLQAYAPATPSDFAHWSGLPMVKTRPAWEALKNELVELSLDDLPVWMLETQCDALEMPASSHSLRLLPRFDTYWMGYTKHRLAVPPDFEKAIFPGGGMIHPAILKNGQAIGTWRASGKKAGVKVKAEPFCPPDHKWMQEISAEESDIRRFFSEQE